MSRKKLPVSPKLGVDLRKHQQEVFGQLPGQRPRKEIRSKANPSNPNRKAIMHVFCRIKESKEMFFLEEQISEEAEKKDLIDLGQVHENRNVRKLMKFISGYSGSRQNPLMLLDSKRHGMLFKKNPLPQPGKFQKNVIYKFDGILSPLRSQEESFEMIAGPLFERIRTNQINTGMIFAYGYTNSGKTYSILGDTRHLDLDFNQNIFFQRKSIGILPRILVELIGKKKPARIEDSREWVSEIKLSAFEIYQEKVFDLFIDRPKLTKNKKNLETSRKFNQLESHHGKYNFKKERILNLEDAFKSLKMIEANRSVDNNGINVKSSRSHTVFKIEFFWMKYDDRESKSIEQEAEKAVHLPKKEIKSARKEIMIVDLAGAEKPNPERGKVNPINWHIAQSLRKEAGFMSARKLPKSSPRRPLTASKARPQKGRVLMKGFRDMFNESCTINKSLFNLKRCFEALQKMKRVPLRDSELTRLVFENFSKSKLSLNILLNVNCSKVPFIVLNPQPEDLEALPSRSKTKSELVKVGPERRLTVREDMRRSLGVKGPPKKVSLVDVAASAGDSEVEICNKSVDLGEDVLDWSDTASCASFRTCQASNKRPRKKKEKIKWFEEIEKVLEFGENAKQITNVKLIKNPTIENLKKSALRLEEIRRQQLLSGKDPLALK